MNDTTVYQTASLRPGPNILVALVIWIAALLKLSLFHGRGIDVTDTGFILTNQWMQAFHPEEYRYGAIWLTDVVGGLWLKFTGDPGLLVARFGANVLDALLAVLVYFSLSAVMRWDLSALCSLAALHVTRGTPITYNPLGAFLLLAAITLLIRGSGSRRPVRQSMLYAASGALLALAAMAKVSLFLGVSIPIAACVIIGSETGKNAAFRAFLASFAGYLLGLGLAALYLAHVGGISAYFGVFTGDDPLAGNDLHDPVSLLTRYARQTAGAIALLLAIALPVMAACVFRVPRSSRAVIGYCAFSCAALGLMLFAVPDTVGRQDIKAAVYLGINLLALFLAVRELRARSGEPGRVLILLLPVLASGCIMAGSATGLVNLGEMSAIVVPAVVLSWAGQRAILMKRPVRIRALVAGFVLLAALGLVARLMSPFRDARNPFALTNELTHQRLRGVKTSPRRAAAIDEMLKELNRHAKPGDTILAYSHIPLVHYTTETLPATGCPWPVVYRPDRLQERLGRLESQHRLPVVVRALPNLQRRRWGVGRSKQGKADQRKMDILDSWVAQNRYLVIWQSECFEILEVSAGGLKGE